MLYKTTEPVNCLKIGIYNLLFMKSVVIIMLTEHCYRTNYYRCCNLKMFGLYWLQSIDIRGLRRQKYVLSDPWSDSV